LTFKNKFNPENHEARIETDPNGKKVLNWYEKNNQTPLIIPNPTSIPALILTPKPNVEVDQDFQQSDLEIKYDLAVKAVNSNQLEKAENYLIAYLKIDPKRQTAFYLLGYVQNRLKKTDEAIAIYQKYLSFDPNNKYRYSAASELVYLLAKTNNGCEKAVHELKKILFDERIKAFSVDEKTGKMVRKAWLAALGCRAVNANQKNQSGIAVDYMTWKKYLLALSDQEYQTDKALNEMPTEINGGDK
jgi:tetratricopeptide (TPR) repeat protein